MKNSRKYTAILAAIALVLFSIDIKPVGSAKSKNPFVRVCVVKNADSITLEIKDNYSIKTLHTNELLTKADNSLRTVKVVPTNSGLKIGEQEFKVFGIRIIPTVGGKILLDERRFRGIVDILRTKEMKLLVVNYVNLEDYLYGVLYYETPHYWPMETLMAQAIVARTFAVYRIEEMVKADYDLTNDAFSQVYGGKEGERWRTKWAVDLTKGKVLKYKGEILPAYYHSTCGGHTEKAAELWNVDLEPLKGRKCKYCRRAPYYKWKAMFSYRQMEERLNKYGIACKKISYIIEGPRDRSGRLRTVRIRDKSGVKDIPANTFRLALGGLMIKSTKFNIRITRKGVIFRGYGWGHGVGMCQWGAYGMAKKGYDCKQILRYYYPGAKIEPI